MGYFFCQILRRDPASKSCDVYSFGVLLYELVTQQIPFADIVPVMIPSKIAEGKVSDSGLKLIKLVSLLNLKVSKYVKPYNLTQIPLLWYVVCNNCHKVVTHLESNRYMVLLEHCSWVLQSDCMVKTCMVKLFPGVMVARS